MVLDVQLSGAQFFVSLTMNLIVGEVKLKRIRRIAKYEVVANSLEALLLHHQPQFGCRIFTMGRNFDRYKVTFFHPVAIGTRFAPAVV